MTAKSIQKLTDSANRVVGTFENQIVKFGDTADAISGAANKVGSVANSAQDLIEVNREKLAQTLDGIAAASREARSLLASAKPLLNDGKLIANLQKLADNFHIVFNNRPSTAFVCNTYRCVLAESYIISYF